MSDNRTTEKLMREFVDAACECEVRDYLISEYAERIEQAIAATLGRPNATDNQESIVRSFLRKISPNRDWDYLGEHEHALIADLVDDIAATLGSGTCENIAPEYLDFLCSKCGFVHYHSDENDSGDGNDWAFCPNCGKAVKR